MIDVNIVSALDLPFYASEGAAGMDIRAYIPKTIILYPGERALVPTGIKVDIPRGYKINVLPRSGLAYKNGITVLNSPGLIDSDYKGDIGVILINHGHDELEIKPGDRIAQIELAPVLTISWVSVNSLESSARGEKGFGSTGV